MKVFSGLTGITESFIAQGAYAALDYIQNLFRNLDSVAIDSGEPGQLITLSGTADLIESLGAGSYKINAPTLVSGLIPLSFFPSGIGGGALPVLADLPEAPANGEALLALCQIPSDIGIYLAPLADTWANNTANWVHDCAFQQWSPHCVTIGISVTKELTIKKLASYSMKYEGTAGQQIAVLNPENYQLGTGAFTIDCWFYPTISTGVQYILNCREGSGGGMIGWHLRFAVDSDKHLDFGTHNTIILASGAWPAITYDDWNHIAIERYDGTIKMFLNGVSVASASDTTNFNHTWPLLVGGVHAGDTEFIGYIEGVRVRPGVTPYLGVDFTPATTEPVPAKKYCLVLMRGTSGNPVYEVINRMAV